MDRPSFEIDVAHVDAPPGHIRGEQDLVRYRSTACTSQGDTEAGAGQAVCFGRRAETAHELKIRRSITS